MSADLPTLSCPRCCGDARLLSGVTCQCETCRYLFEFDGDRFPISMRCDACGYDLRGNRSPICPECGHALSPAQRRHLAGGK